MADLAALGIDPPADRTIEQTVIALTAGVMSVYGLRLEAARGYPYPWMYQGLIAEARATCVSANS